MGPVSLTQAILDLLPQTQCTRCGYPDCASYAKAIAQEQVPINQCPPGGLEGIERLAQLTVQAVQALNPINGTESSRSIVWIDENWCIGCALCLDACPTDAIVGTHKRMHTVIEPYCTGCELCLPVCPVDCMHLENVTGDKTGWQAWSDEQALMARTRYESRQIRKAQEEIAHAKRNELKARAKLEDLDGMTRMNPFADQDQERSRKKAIIKAAIARAQTKQLKD